MKVIECLDFELFQLDVAVQDVSYYMMEYTSSKEWFEILSLQKRKDINRLLSSTMSTSSYWWIDFKACELHRGYLPPNSEEIVYIEYYIFIFRVVS